MKQKKICAAFCHILHLFIMVNILVSSACIPKSLQQKYIDEELWEQVSRKSEIEYKLVEVTPVNFLDVIEESNEIFMPKCNWALDPLDYEPYIYRLGVGDEVMVKVNVISGSTQYFEGKGKDLVNILPDSSAESILSSYKVSSEGYLSLPYIGKVQAEGMTTQQIEELLLQQLSIYYNMAFVEVKLFMFKSKWVEVVGAVDNMSRIPIDTSAMTVQRAIIESKGLSEDADLREAFIQRGEEKIPVDLYALLYEGEQNFNYRMEHKDILIIPSTTKDRIFLTGEVMTRRVIETNFHNFTLSDILITDKDVINPTFNNTKNIVYVLRSIGNREESSLCPSYSKPDNPIMYMFKFDFRMPQMLMLAGGFQLLHKDIVYISTSPSQTWNRTINLFVPILPYFL